MKSRIPVGFLVLGVAAQVVAGLGLRNEERIEVAAGERITQAPEAVGVAHSGGERRRGAADARPFEALDAFGRAVPLRLLLGLERARADG